MKPDGYRLRLEVETTDDAAAQNPGHEALGVLGQAVEKLTFCHEHKFWTDSCRIVLSDGNGNRVGFLTWEPIYPRKEG